MDQRTQHDARILDQFTRQAEPFADNPAHAQASALALILAASDLSAGDEALDVACGPGLLTAAIARSARRVVGVDVVPAMLARAERERAARGLDNLSFQLGDARKLPFDDAAFDKVFTRFSFHHLMEPAHTLAEMVRVCRPGGAVIVIDATPPAALRAAYDAMELLRDPSHVKALTPEELRGLFAVPTLSAVRERTFDLSMDLEQQLAASFPNPGDDDRIRALFRNDLNAKRDSMGLKPREHEGKITFSYPCSIIAATVC